ncbi:MAG TPA: GntR family transcriptional regulator [Candidatus Fimenecus stercoravium]|nr:GntR family transcriptional regulator [Candidatus Fimenecus stercoravium]
MQIFIDNKSGVPIYEQIYSQIKTQIISGAIAENEALPSIRNLAKDLRISVITTKRAYDELEKEGFLYTVAGKGCFVAPKNTELLREENLKAIEAHLSEAVRLAASCNLSRADILEMLNLLTEENE